uniref:Ornithine carbamoyltransferase n=1 Tax=uncultured bacterium A1Q1_fos_862 TaxID=1256590 RepID=L7VTQ1_9BACT|nr:ornithine carbamoyltransferase [uncultured bacterium A1Q1_fos_862]
MRHLLEIDDLTGDELRAVLDLSEQDDLPRVLEGKGAVLLFEKPSARTRTSAEMAVFQLGGHPITLRNEEVGIDTRESAADLGRLFAGYAAVVGARVFEHHKVERLAAASSVPVINLLSDEAHPVQALADLLTIRQEFATFDDVVVTYVGDANNVARSLGIACGLVGMTFRVSNPPGYGFDDASVGRLAAAGCAVELIEDPADAVAGADVVYTDAWYSMGQEEEQAIRTRAFDAWRVDEALMGRASDRAIFLHCLPAHRGDEATDGVLDGQQSRIWRQAQNRMHTKRGLIAWLLSEGPS